MKKILVVDDDEDILHLVKIVLTSRGYDVQTHNTGLNVIDIVRMYNPNLILLDIRLPGKLGTDICKELKAISDKPIILLITAHASKGEAFALCNADGFIQKPFDVKNLTARIKSFIV